MWTIKRYNPFDDFKNLQSEMNRLFSSFNGNQTSFPAVNILAGSDEVIICAELPGISKDDINISVQDDIVKIEGERKAEDAAEGQTYHRSERGFGGFARSFRLPYDISSDKVKAKYSDGILKITMPRAEESKPRKIAVV